jgi:hypothetical protein
MKLNPGNMGKAVRCAKCGCPVSFDGIVELGEDAETGHQALAAFRCGICGHGFVDLMERSKALAMESRLQPAA